VHVSHCRTRYQIQRQNKAVFSEEDFHFFAGVNDCCLTLSFSAITWRDQVTF